jgi:hypothetical protein
MVLVVNMIPRALSGEVGQDSEPTLAVNPANTQQIVGTAFTRDPLGGTLAPIYVSSDGGQTWSLNLTVPSQTATSDITVAFSSTTNTLYAGILRIPSPPQQTRLNILRTGNYLSPTPMTVLVDRLGPDQPYVQAVTIPSSNGNAKDRVYVGMNDFAAPGTSTVDVSLDAAVAKGKFKSIQLEKSGKQGQNGPQVRPACHADGTVYIAFYRWLSTTGDWPSNTLVVTADIVIVRDDNGGQGSKPFQALKGANGVAGLEVARGVTFPFHQTGQGVPGQQRLGGDLAIAVSPQDSALVYLAYCDLVAGGGYTMHVRRSSNRGATWSNDLLTVPMAINAGLAINSAGQVGLLYQQLTGAGTGQRWVTHFQQSANGTNWSDLILSTAPADTPRLKFSPYLGDYAHLMAVGQTFYGIFSASNTPDRANFPNGVTYLRNADFTNHRLLDVDRTTPVAVSIDPFFFRVP